MADWQYSTPLNIGQPGSTNLVGYRSIIDAKRTMAAARTPEAEWPDGYLGTITSRRGDRLLNAIKTRLTQRSYQRGVHKGEKIDPSDYYWTEEVNPDIGLQYESYGLKWTAQGNVAERLAHGGIEMASPAEIAAAASSVGLEGPASAEIDPVRQARLARLLPGWR